MRNPIANKPRFCATCLTTYEQLAEYATAFAADHLHLIGQHSFRHAFISGALASGIPESQVRAWVGHVDPGTIKLHTHIADSQSQNAMNKLTSLNGSGSNVNPQVNHKEVADVSETQKIAEAAQNQHNHQEPSDGVDAK